MDELNTPRNALDAGIAAAALHKPVIEMEDGRRFAQVPDGFDLQNISDPHLLPPHIEQTITVDDRDSFTAYANRFSDDRSLIVADYDNGKISAYLDWHKDNNHELKPQKVKHTSTLRMRDSLEYERWSKMEGDLHSQSDFAYFIEENVADVTDPDSSDLVEICRELEATQGANFKSGQRLDNGDRSFTYENETHVKNQLAVPTQIKLLIPLYFGEEPTEITANFRFRVNPDGLRLGFQWHRVEYQRQAKFREMATLAADETGLPVFFGRC